jgi:hypothetical protein
MATLSSPPVDARPVTDDERWVPATTPTLLGGLLGGVAVGVLVTAAVVVDLGGPPVGDVRPEWLRTVLLALPPGPVGRPTAGLAAVAGVRPTVLGGPVWVALVAVGWVTTGRRAEEWPAALAERFGPVRAPHRRLANWLGRGAERLRVRLGARAYRRATLHHSVAVGVGYGLAVAAVVWLGGNSATINQWLGTAASAAFAACCGTVGGLLRGARER